MSYPLDGEGYPGLAKCQYREFRLIRNRGQNFGSYGFVISDRSSQSCVHLPNTVSYYGLTTSHSATSSFVVFHDFHGNLDYCKLDWQSPESGAFTEISVSVQPRLLSSSIHSGSRWSRFRGSHQIPPPVRCVHRQSLFGSVFPGSELSAKIRGGKIDYTEQIFVIAKNRAG